MAEVQALLARQQESLGVAASQSDEHIKAVVEDRVTALQHSVTAVEASIAQLHYEQGISAAAAAPVRAPPGHQCGPCGANPFRAGGGAETGVPASGFHGFHHGPPQGPPGIGQGAIFPNGLCHCDHVVGHGQALTLLTTRVAASETLDKHVTDEIHSLAARLQTLELARARFLQEGVYSGPQDHHHPGGGDHHGRGYGQGGAPGESTGAVIKWSSKLFDDRTALNELFQYGGDKGGDAWRTRVRGYFIGCCPELADWLDWAEGAPGKSPQRSDTQQVTMQDTIERYW